MQIKANRFEVFWVFAILLILTYATLVNVASHNDVNIVWYLAVCFIVMLLLSYLSSVIVNKIPFIPRELCTIYFSAVLLAISGIPAAIVIALLIALLSGYGIYALYKQQSLNRRPLSRLIPLYSIIALSALSFIAAFPFLDRFNTNNQIYPAVVFDKAESTKNKVITFSYGSGTDKHRPAFAERASLITQPFNAEAMLKAWRGFSGWYRSYYWGFDPSSLPLNARVWQPKSDGPFPVVLIVHGDHAMQDYSDEGYAYLAADLADQGYFVVSIDENFLNRSWSDLLLTQTLIGQDEMKVRALIVLEHLKQLAKWNHNSASPLYQHLDLNNVAVIGHSRGGEAMSHIPHLLAADTIKDVTIKSVVAIAPVFNNYRPNNQMNTIDNTHYLLIHGDLDRELFFEGRGQYTRAARASSVNENEVIKIAAYIKGANHGQFNSVWGNCDHKFYSSFCSKLNKKTLLPNEVQQFIAKALISSFLSFTLQNNQPIDLEKTDALIKQLNPLTTFTPIKFQYQTSGIRHLIDFEKPLPANTISTHQIAATKIKQITRGAQGHYIAWPAINNRLNNTEAHAEQHKSWVTYDLPNNQGSAAHLAVDIANLSPIDHNITVKVNFTNNQEQLFTLSLNNKLAAAYVRQLMTLDYILGLSSFEAAFTTYTLPLNNTANVESVSIGFEQATAGEVILDNIGFY